MKKFLILTFIILTLLAPVYFCNAMSITSFSPLEGKTYTLVTINGIDFKNVSEVLFGGVPTPIKSINGTTITAEVPLRAVTGKITIRTNTTDILSPTDFKVLPFSLTFTPTSAKVGELITLSSESIIGGGSDVYFNGVKAPATVTDAMNEITVKVPTGATTGKITVKNQTFGDAVSSIDFTITPASGTGTLGDPVTPTPPNTPTATGAITFDGKSLVPTCNTGVIGADGNYVNKCDFNMIMALVNKIISFCLIYLATPLFALIMIYVGYLYLTASASSENISLAKKILKNALFGYIISLAAWLVIKSVLATLGVVGIDTYLK